MKMFLHVIFFSSFVFHGHYNKMKIAIYFNIRDAPKKFFWDETRKRENTWPKNETEQRKK